MCFVADFWNSVKKKFSIGLKGLKLVERFNTSENFSTIESASKMRDVR
jgi:hypothetical protein